MLVVVPAVGIGFRVGSIVAFANTAGSVLLLGVEDSTGNVCDVATPLAMEERLANLISDSILQRLIRDIEILPWRRTHVLAISSENRAPFRWPGEARANQDHLSPSKKPRNRAHSRD